MSCENPVRILIVLATEGNACFGHGNVPIQWLAPAYYLFRDTGADVVIATPDGGDPGIRLADPSPVPAVERFLTDRRARDDLAEPLGLSQIVTGDFDAALCLGFQGDIRHADPSGIAPLLSAMSADGRPVGLVPGDRLDLGTRGPSDGILVICGEKSALGAAQILLDAVTRTGAAKSR